MISRWQLRLMHLGSKVWVRATLLALLGVLTALVAVKLDPLVPNSMPTTIGAAAIKDILNILASSMLAVTTFSLNVMVSSLSAATSNVTPRATRLLMEDTTTQNVLAVFLGTFLYSLVGIVALNTGYYSESGRFVLFAITVGVIGVVVLTIIRWIDHLTRLGRVGETTERVEHATRDAIKSRIETPYLGGTKLTDEVRQRMAKGQPIFPTSTGYVTYVDLKAVQQVAESLECEIGLVSLPGSFVYPTRPLAVLLSGDTAREDADDENEREQLEKLSKAFDIETSRSFRQDPRFGMSVLAEVASRALSPAVNDPGTAIDVIGRGVRLMAPWVQPRQAQQSDPPRCRLVHVPSITDLEMLEDFFTPIARDGAAIVEVQIRLQKALCAIAELGSDDAKAAALRISRLAIQRAEMAIALKDDQDRVRQAARPLQALTLSGT